MKCTIPEISWHNRDPVLSLDIQRSQADARNYRLATGGTDSHVLIWQLCILDNGAVSVEMLSDLTRHNRPVNAVRFSPDRKILVSSDDEAAIILWKRHEDPGNDIFVEDSEKDNKEHWSILKMLRGHREDVYDLSWSQCSQYLISGSVDNTAILWDVQKGKNIGILNDHKGFVQGVTWDPRGQYVATLSSDRCLRIYNIGTKKVVHKVQKCKPGSPQSADQKLANLFYDDTLKSFCRRLTFSPDGELLVAPSGILENGEGKVVNVTHVFSRCMLTRPVMCFPTQDKYTVAVRFCPVLYQLKKPQEKTSEAWEDKNCNDGSAYTNLFQLPYRMVFAVAAQNSVLIYDTQQPIPFAKISNIHYTRLSDLSWSSDGRLLVISSTDGYCSLVSFTKDELGVPYIGTAHTNADSPGAQNEKTASHSSVDSKRKIAEEMEIDGICVLEDAEPTPSVEGMGKHSSEQEKNEKFKLARVNRSEKVVEHSGSSTSLGEGTYQKEDKIVAAERKENDVTDIKSEESSKEESTEQPIDVNTERTKENDQKINSKNTSEEIQTKAQPIAVKRKNNSKPGKRVQLITLSAKVDRKKSSSTEGSSKAHGEETSEECPESHGESVTEKKMEVREPPMAELKSVSSNEELSSTEMQPGAKADVDENETKPSESEHATCSEPLTITCASPSQIAKPGPKTPRRVPLITLSSPKHSKTHTPNS